MRRIARQWLLIGVTLGLFPALAYAEGDELRGVWKGSFGKQEIMACFNDEASGSYYYLRYATLIRLNKKKLEPQWEEAIDMVTGIWTQLVVKNDELSGLWQKIGELNTLPIQLKRVPQTIPNDTEANNYQACGSDAYAKLLDEQQKVIVGKSENFHGISYRYHRLKWAVADVVVETIELLAGTPQTVAINKLLYQSFTKDIADLKDCNRQLLERAVISGGTSIKITPRFIGTHFLMIERDWDDEVCGNGKSGRAFITYDLATGAEADFSHWFIGDLNATYKHEDSSAAAKAITELRKIILPECIRVNGKENISDGETCISGESYYSIRLSRKGVLFDEGGINGAVIEIPYKKLMPYLSKEGRGEVTLLMKSKLFELPSSF